MTGLTAKRKALYALINYSSAEAVGILFAEGHL